MLLSFFIVDFLGKHFLGEDACNRCFPGSTRTGKEVCMGELVLRTGLDKRVHDVILSDHFGEDLRPVFSVQGHRRLQYTRLL